MTVDYVSSSSEEIKPCPFCGKPGKLNSDTVKLRKGSHLTSYWIVCSNKDKYKNREEECPRPTTSHYSIEIAKKNWNKRSNS